MKALIWFLFIFLTSVVVASLKSAGMTLGAIPTMIIYAPMFIFAPMLCKKWDERKKGKNGIQQCAACGCTQFDKDRKCQKCGCAEKKIFTATNNGQPTVQANQGGQQIEKTKPEPKRCAKCGATLFDDSKFCSVCGTKVK